MSRSEAEFVHRENIKHFEKKLATESDPAAQTMLLELLDEEKAKFRHATNRAAKPPAN